MRDFATVDESFDRLHRAGWSIGEVSTPSGWRVSGTNGENALNVTGRTQAEPLGGVRVGTGGPRRQNKTPDGA